MAEELEEEEEESSPTPSSPSDRHGIFSADNVVVFVVAELIAAPLCIAGGDHFVRSEWLEAIFGYGVGVPIGAIGFTFPFWKHRISAHARDWIWRVSQWLAPIAIVFVLFYVAGPVFYHRAIQEPVSTSAHSENTTVAPPQDVLSLIASLRAQLDTATNTVQSQKRELEVTKRDLELARHPLPRSGPFGTAYLTLAMEKGQAREVAAENVRWLVRDTNARTTEMQWPRPVTLPTYGLGTLSSEKFGGPDLSTFADGIYEVEKAGPNNIKVYGTGTMTLIFMSFDKPVDTGSFQLSSDNTLPKWKNSCKDNSVCLIWFDQRPENLSFTIRVGR